MADTDDSKHGTARSFAPGTFERTRKNIGPIDEDEAKEMAMKIGGEILPERAPEPDPATVARRNRSDRVIVRASGQTSSDISSRSAALSSSISTGSTKSMTTEILKKTDADLPAVTAKDLKLMNKLMMSEEYGIKPNYGVFNFIFNLSAKNKEKVVKDLGDFK
ncbi:MAG: hypothetical protein II054_05495, partial [Treponema sp.]|nr:hypothetical protein [Treponema sp.]